MLQALRIFVVMRKALEDDDGSELAVFQSSDGPSAFRNGLTIHLNSENGLTVAMTLPRINANGTGPKYLESRDATRLSPTIQQWPFGT